MKLLAQWFFQTSDYLHMSMRFVKLCTMFYLCGSVPCGQGVNVKYISIQIK